VFFQHFSYLVEFFLLLFLPLDLPFVNHRHHLGHAALNLQEPGLVRIKVGPGFWCTDEPKSLLLKHHSLLLNIQIRSFSERFLSVLERLVYLLVRSHFCALAPEILQERENLI